MQFFNLFSGGVMIRLPRLLIFAAGNKSQEGVNNQSDYICIIAGKHE